MLKALLARMAAWGGTEELSMVREKLSTLENEDLVPTRRTLVLVSWR